MTKIHSSAANGMSKRDIEIPASAFVPNAFQQGAGIASSQFGMYTTAPTLGFDQSGSAVIPEAPGVDQSVDQSVMTNGTIITPGVTNPVTPPTANSPVTPTTPGTDGGVTSGGSGVTSGGFGTMKKRHNTEPEEPAGYLVLGGVDKSIIDGDVNYLRLAADPEAPAKNWDICIRHASFGNLKLKQAQYAIASISTSTSFIVMPPQQADAFHEEFGAEYDQATKSYNIKCSEIKDLPLLKMTLEDHIVELPPKYWTGLIDLETDSCYTKISRGNSESDWVLGTSLTNAFYTTFDPEADTVGLAIKKGQSKDGLRVYRKSH